MALAKRDSGKAWFIRQVAEGDTSLDAEVITKFSEQLGINFISGSYFCIAVQYADNHILLENISRLAELEMACSRLEKGQEHDIFCYIGPQMRVVMVVSA